MNDESIRAVAAAIKRYLADRPASADTAEGIHQWWIDWGGHEESLAVTLQALELLEQAHQVESIRFGNQVLWRGRAPAGSSCRNDPVRLSSPQA